jgi:hypothetical protein
MPASEGRQTLVRPLFRIFVPRRPCSRPDLIIGLNVRAARNGDRARFGLYLNGIGASRLERRSGGVLRGRGGL